MPDYRTMFEKDYLYAFMLGGKDHVVEIERVKGGELTGEGGKKTKKPVCWFKGKKKPLALNATNCKTIAAMYGNNTEQWIGKRITIFPTTTEFGGKTCDCIRVRSGIPRGNATTQSDPEPSDNDLGDDEPPAHIELPTEPASAE